MIVYTLNEATRRSLGQTSVVTSGKKRNDAITGGVLENSEGELVYLCFTAVVVKFEKNLGRPSFPLNHVMLVHPVQATSRGKKEATDAHFRYNKRF